MKTCYTALFGDYDDLKPVKGQDGWRFIVYTDQDISPKGWDVRKVNPPHDPLHESRRIKIMYHDMQLFNESLWMDARFEIHGSLDNLIKNITAPIGVMKHPVRSGYSEEADAVIREKNGGREVNAMVSRYKLMEIPEANLPATGLLYRNGDTRAFSQRWYYEMSHSLRDQLSFNYAAYTTSTAFQFMHGNIYDRRNPVFRLHKHKSY